ncbi:hypothetical protein K3495_g9350 [Podosphaera aphanis]|nr:hypothetical protein K3495_g9350 [Podosphaera aphanis]
MARPIESQNGYRQVHAFIRPDKGMTNDLFLLLGLPWLHSVKAVINISKSQVRIGDKKLGERRTTLQGPTFKFTQHHLLLLEPTKIPFEGVLKAEPCDWEEIYDEIVPLNCGDIPKARHSTPDKFNEQSNGFKSTPRDNAGEYSSSCSEDSVTVDGSDDENNFKQIEYISASTDSDLSTEDEYSTDENSLESMDAHSIN